MGARKYHYEWISYTDNLAYGRMKIAQDRSYTMAAAAAQFANKGAWSIKKIRVYDDVQS